MCSLQDGESTTRRWVNPIVKATCVLHNYLQGQTTPEQITALLKEASEIDIEGLQDLTPAGNRGGVDAINIRKLFADYFVDVSPVSWQNDHVNRGIFND